MLCNHDDKIEFVYSKKKRAIKCKNCNKKLIGLDLLSFILFCYCVGIPASKHIED